MTPVQRLEEASKGGVEQVRKLARNHRIYLGAHAVDHQRREGFEIIDIVHCIINSRFLGTEPNDQTYYPPAVDELKYEFQGHDTENQPFMAVCKIFEADDGLMLWIITTHETK